MGSYQQGHDTTNVFSTPVLGDVEVVDVPFPLPLESREMKEKNARYFIKAYCNNCKNDAVHAIYVNRSYYDYLEIKCTVCGHTMQLCNYCKIDAFVKLYCPICQRETVHALYNDGLRCVGCGRFISL